MTGTVLANVPEGHTTKYLADAERINEALPIEDVAHYFKSDAIPMFEDHLGKLDKAAWDTLDTVPSIPKDDVLKVGQDFIDGILKGKNGNLSRVSGTGADADKIRAVAGQLEEIAAAYGDNLSQSDLKSIVQSLQKLGYSLEGSPRTSIQGQAMQQLSGAYNEVLRNANPEYAKAMVPVQEGTQALQTLKSQFINQSAAPESIDKFLQKAKNFGSKSPESDAVRSIGKLDQVTGSGIGEMLDDASVLKSFQKADTQGSRKTIFGSVIGGAVGSLAGPAGATVGATVGAAAGQIGDKYAGAMFKGLLNGRLGIEKAAPMLTQKLGKYAKPLIDAASRGQGAVAATHFILSQKDPEYRAKIKQFEQDE